jgi:hypothetical protein
MSHFVLTIIAILCIVIGSVHSAGCTSDDYAMSSLLPYLPLAFSAVLIAQRYLVTNVIKILMENGWPLLTSIMLCMHVTASADLHFSSHFFINRRGLLVHG